MNKTIIIFLLLIPIQFLFSSSIEINYFGDIDNPLPKLIITKSNKYGADLNFETMKGFELTILIREVQYNKIMDSIRDFSEEIIQPTNGYFVCQISNEIYYFPGFEKMLAFLNFLIMMVEDQNVITYLIDYIHRIEILSFMSKSPTF
jgi:hypothetical protein